VISDRVQAPNDRDIHPKARVDPVIAVKRRQRNLPSEQECTRFKLICQALPVNRLRKPRTEDGMHRKRGIDDLPPKRVQTSWRLGVELERHHHHQAFTG
jgi:hypothetical protein